MNKIILWIKRIIFVLVWLIIIKTILTYTNILILSNSDLEKTNNLSTLTLSSPIYQSNKIIRNIYNSSGEITYQIIANNVKYFEEMKILKFKNPISTIFNNKKIPIWSILADNGKLSNEKILYLYGSVQIKSLEIQSKINCIITESLVINLVTQDIASDYPVKFYCSRFNSIGMKMRGNLHKKTAELIGNVNTYYKTNQN